MIRNRQGRTEAVRTLVEGRGWLHGSHYAFGDEDMVVLVETPDNTRRPLPRWPRRHRAS